MLVGMYERDICPDYIVFADTGGEKPETYEFLTIMREWCHAQGMGWIYSLKKTSIYNSLEDECLKKNTLPALAFGFRSCSDKWKQAPQQKFLNNREDVKELWKSGGKIIKAIGFGVDELHRAKEYEDDKSKNWYPLIEWRWNRNDCLQAIKDAGLPHPPKSSCFYCPAMRKAEIVQLSIEHPDLYKRALAMEKNATTVTQVKGLGRSFSWSELVGSETVEQVCMCFDGEEV